jgi:hypothetical protein
MTMEQPNTADPIPVKDASRENTPFNKNMYNGYDPLAMYIGKYTVLDDTTRRERGVQRERVRHELVRTVQQRRD